MKIGLNATCFNNRSSGAKHRFIGLYSNVISNFNEAQFIIYQASDYDLSKYFSNIKNVKFKNTPIPSSGYILKSFKNYIFWKNEIKREKFNILENFNLPSINNNYKKTILTLHDIRGQKTGWGIIKSQLFDKALKKSINELHHIITVSETVKKEILIKFPKAKVDVIYNGINPKEYQTIDPALLNNFKKKFNIFNNFILSVGHLEIRKNFLNLILSLKYLRDQNLNYNLLIIGNDSGQKTELIKKIKELNLNDNVKIISGLTDLEVKCAYSLCDLFIFPSIYEGFGIPILEAMIYNKPIILSNIEVFKEITENKLSYFDCNNIQMIAESIHKICSSDNEKNKLIKYSKNRIKNFNYDKLSYKIISIYKNI